MQVLTHTLALSTGTMHLVAESVSYIQVMMDGGHRLRIHQISIWHEFQQQIVQRRMQTKEVQLQETSLFQVVQRMQKTGEGQG
jgi:hypothetical protein